MNTARLAPARPRVGNGKAHEARRATLSPGTPLRGWARAALNLIRRRYLGVEPHKQLWTWFLPNPVLSGREQPEQPQSACEANVNRGANIMLVEHDGDTRERLRLWLQLDGHLVAEAADPAEALKIIAQEPPDVVLLGLCGSAMSWMEFFLGMSRLRPRPNVRVIGLAPSTAQGGGCDEIRFFASDVLHQPVRQDELRRAVAAALREIRQGACDAPTLGEQK